VNERSAEKRNEADIEPKHGWGRTFAALAEPRFRLLWVGSLLSFFAMQMTQVARPWLAYEVSGSGLALGLVAAAQGIPMLLISPFGGVAADRLPKRVVLLVSQGVLLATAAGMVVLVELDLVQVWHLVLLAFIHGCTVPFNQPVRQSYIPLLLDRQGMPNGIALFASARNMNQVLAPSIVGPLLLIDPGLAFMAIALLHLLSMTVSLRLPWGPPELVAGRGAFGEVWFGLRYIGTRPVLRTLVGMMLLAVILGHPFQQLLAVFQGVLNINAAQFAFFYTALGTGSLLASLTVASFSHLAARGYPQLIAGVMFGVALAGFALSPVYLLSLALLFVLGFASQSYSTMNQTLMMLHSPAALYGRVASVNMMTRAFMPLTVLPMGALVDAFGAPATLAVSGALLALAILAIGTFVPSLRHGRGPQ
jgi:MFS family permease